MGDIDIFGIDLGTTNSLIAYWNPDTRQAEVVGDQDGNRLLPSVVSFDSSTGEPVAVGRSLEDHRNNAGEAVYSVKRFIGRSFREESVKEDKGRVTYEIAETTDKTVVIRIGDREMTPSQVSALILQKLKAIAETRFPGKPVNRAVITVPAYFNEAQ